MGCAVGGFGAEFGSDGEVEVVHARSSKRARMASPWAGRSSASAKVMTVVEISLRAGSSYSMRLTGRRKVWVDRPALNRFSKYKILLLF